MAENAETLASVSGGESSRRMLDLLIEQGKKVIPIFSNTGLEHQKTINFIKRIQDHIKKEIICVESVVHSYGVGTTYKIVTLDNLSMNGEPMEEVIQKYGLPGIGYLHCTRELKAAPIHSWAKKNLSEKYETAIGIRADEVDRMNPDHKELRFSYPLIKAGIRKFDVIEYSKKQPFKLEIPQWLGNCQTCYKKSDRKLNAVYRYNSKLFDFWERMEKLYSHVGGSEEERRIFREKRTTSEMITMFRQQLTFDDTANGCGGHDSCEPF